MTNDVTVSFLEDALNSIERQSANVGTVRVSANEHVDCDKREIAKLVMELLSCIRENTCTPERMNSPQGCDIQVPDKYECLKKYVHTMELRSDPNKQWVQVNSKGDAGERGKPFL